MSPTLVSSFILRKLRHVSFSIFLNVMVFEFELCFVLFSLTYAPGHFIAHTVFVERRTAATD